MKKLMILGASVGQIELIQKAKELGYKLALVDYDDKAVAIPYADKFYHVSTIDVDGVINAAIDFKPDGITTIQTDMPIRAIAAACSALGINGLSPEVALKATDKEEMIKAFKQHNVCSPYFFVVRNKDSVDTIASQIKSYPCIFKPVDNSASRGVTLVDKPTDINGALFNAKDNSKNGNIIVEEYMQGPEVSVEVIMLDGKEHVLAVTDKITTGPPHFVEMGHTEQSRIDEENIYKIKKLAGDALRAIGVLNGPGHVEIILTREGPKLVELGARLGGDFITSDLVPLSTGIDMMAAVIQIACGETPNITPKFNKGSAIRFISSEEGIIESVEGIEEARACDGITKVDMFRDIGDLVTPIRSSLDRIGCIIAQGETAEQAAVNCENALRKIRVAVRNVAVE